MSDDKPLRDRLIYLAHPVDLATPQQTAEMHADIEDVRAGLLHAGAVVFDPAQAFDVPTDVPPNDRVESVNRQALWRADGLVACFPEHSIGVPMEIQYAAFMKKAIGIHTSVAEKSWALAAVDHLPMDTTWDDAWMTTFGELIDIKQASPAGDQLRYTGPEEFAPERKHEDDAGFDLFVSEQTFIPSGAVRDVPCGVNLELPSGIFGLVIGRSSTSRKHHLRIDPSVIDGGYRGPMFTAVHNTGPTDYLAEVGSRLGQILPLSNMAETLDVLRVDRLSEGSRGDSGFGSTGD